MNRAIVATKPSDWAMIQEIAPVAAAARMFKVTREQAAIVMLKGHELRMGLAAAFEFIHVIDSKPSISPKGCLALIHGSGELKALMINDVADDKGTPTSCNVYMERVNGFKYTIAYSMDDAKRANLIKPGSAWEKYPANMLRWRAVGYCADVVFPDVIGGMLRPEELGAEVDEGGEPVTWSGITTTEPLRATYIPDPILEPVIPVPDVTGWGSGVAAEPIGPTTIDALIAAGYSAEAIVVANEGKVPSTAADCQRVAEILERQTS